jgi:hypothetical protein
MGGRSLAAEFGGSQLRFRRREDRRNLSPHTHQCANGYYRDKRDNQRVFRKRLPA